MSIAFGSGVTATSSFWTAFKSVQSLKAISVQYVDDGTTYSVFGFDGPLAYECTIWKGTVPDGVVAGGYSQVQNDSDKTDFETNYKPHANLAVGRPTTTVVDGYAASTGSAMTAIMATAYAEQTTNAQRSLVSSSASDASAGVGARTVLLTYYDQNLVGPYSETVTLNGTTPVNTVATNVCFIESIRVITVGSNGGNVGTLTLKAAAAGGGATIGTIIVGDNETNWCHHYVATGRVMELRTVFASVRSMYSGNLFVRRFYPTNSAKADGVIAPVLVVPAGSQDELDLSAPVIVSGPAKVALFGRSFGASGTSDWTAGFGFSEV